MKHFLSETDFTRSTVRGVFAMARQLKRQRGRHQPPALAGQTWALIFSKSSTRTRVSFEVGIHELGGNPLFLSKNDIQLGRGESVGDTARVLSRYVHGLVVRTFDHAEVEELAREGSVPVVNALTDLLHPCQIYADAFTLAERWAGSNGDLLDSLQGRKIAFLGDTACNMANSWVLGAAHFGMRIALAGPPGFAPGPEVRARLAAAGYPEDGYEFTSDPRAAVDGADVVYTDVWVSMGREAEAAERLARMQPYRVTPELMARARPGAWFMHCLPAYPGQEVTAEVLASPASIVFDEAENRLHVQKAILAELAQQPRS
jgi:ornithine carbamoyltransferase